MSGRSRAGRLVGRLLRMPAALDRKGTRWLMRAITPPPKVIVLVHRGRKSGRVYKTPVSILAGDPKSDEVVVSPMWGENTDWYRNVIAGGLVEVQSAGATWRVEWHEMDEVGRRAAGQAFLKAHPMYSRMIARTLSRLNDLEGDPVEAVMRELPMIGLRRVGL